MASEAGGLEFLQGQSRSQPIRDDLHQSNLCVGSYGRHVWRGISRALSTSDTTDPDPLRHKIIVLRGVLGR